MKKLSIILACALVALSACTKSKEVHPEIGDGNDEIVTVGMKDVHVEYTRTDHVELNRVVFHYSPADANGNAQQFEAAEMTKQRTFFELTLNDLLKDTLYCYYYELFPNSGSAYNTEQKTFHTQAFDQPQPPTPPSDVPEGAVNGLFAINENGNQFYFSKGNLQYQASTNTWRFAEHQWDYVGNGWSGTVYENDIKCDNFLISPNYDGWIDLFCWGTSGYNHGANCYQPWSTSRDWSDFYPYGQSTGNLYDQTSEADWGYNSISNGGNTTNSWRTLTVEEWVYLFETRITSSGIRFAKAIVNNVKGVILLPDNWSTSTYTLNNTNQSEVSCNSNIINSTQWSVLENAGAVFLPAAGGRYGTDTVDVNYGRYWSSSHMMSTSVFLVNFDDTSLEPGTWGHHYYGQSVRLVHTTQ